MSVADAVPPAQFSRRSQESIPEKTKDAEHRRNQENLDGQTRRRITIIFIAAYMGIVILSAFGPLLIVAGLRWANGSVADYKTVSETLSPLVSGVIGVVGPILGFYFRDHQTKTSK